MKFKLLTPTAKVPTKGTAGSAGYDLYVDDVQPNTHSDMVKYGVSVEIPEGHVGLIVERSSLHHKGIQILNTIGVIDSDYRGELMTPVMIPDYAKVVNGDRITQLVVVPCVTTPVEIVDELTDTIRGDSGFGSTGAN